MNYGDKRAALHGIRVVEFATGVAAPFAGTLLADLGAEVVHVEPTAGDEQRRVGPAKDGVPLWWKVAARNKRSVVLDLDTQGGQDVAARLVGWAQVVIVSDHNDRLVPRGLDWLHVHQLNPRAVLLQVTGCGATTPMGLDTGGPGLGEARSGIAQITGCADGPPMHSGFDHADTTTGVLGAFAVCASLARRNAAGFQGEWIDLATYETLFRIVEWQVVLQDVTGYTSARAGNKMGVAPGAVINTYRTADDQWLTVSASTLRPVCNVAKLLGEPPEMYATVADQFSNAPRLDALLATWVSERTAAEALKVMAELGVVASRIYDMDDIATDQTYAERENIISVADPDLGSVRMPGVIPKLHLRPGEVRHTGPALDADHDVVFRDWLGMDDADLAAARRGCIRRVDRHTGMTPVAEGSSEPAVRPLRPLGSPGMPALDGLRVVEFAHLVAGPLAGSLMADFGAEVVHVEDPGSGDGARYTGPAHDGAHPWWTVAGRNKRSVTLNLRLQAGQELAKDLIRWADVVITNFRPAALERWGLDWPSVHALNPRAVMFQVSANGSNTSARNDPGFGKIGEARSGVVNLTGYPGGPPMHVGFPQADATTALMGAFGIAAALVNRDEPDFEGEWIDSALFEGLFRMVDWQVIVHDQLGLVPDRDATLGVRPRRRGPYLTRDGAWVTVQYDSPMGVASVRAVLESDAESADSVDTELASWISERTADQVLRALSAEDVLCGRVMTTAEMFDDPVYHLRENIITVPDAHFGQVRMQGVVPRLAERPGRVRRTAPRVGQDNDLVYGSWLGRSPDELANLRDAGVIG